MNIHARTVRSTPERSATDTWTFIVDLIAPAGSAARDELLRASGVAASAIASEGPRDVPIVVHGGGPLVRIRCIYDDEAITGDSAKEGALPKCPTEGDGWRVSIPVPKEDLDWVRWALAKKSSRVTARALGEDIQTENADTNPSEARTATIDAKAFFRP